ncbi:TonB-dependent receptor [Geothrix fuzhouensis]|uniref:TonB-dependent receptor n=1 Tax=Geothrix fuzhouensis TaxID=2966451 RepID=UPI002148073B|nr:TonB-dependent receptor [Geothrix fuzhouensis]
MQGTISSIGRLTALIALGGVMLCAQDSTTGAISGTVTGPNGALIAGAKVILDGGRGQVVRVTDANGSFKASALIPGQYLLTVTAAGFETATKLTATASINTLTPVRLVMTRAAGAVVEVVAASQTLDTTTQTSGSTYNAETISALPLGRSFSSVVNLAPGVSSSGIDANNPSVGGSSGLENQYIIDGVNTTGAGYGASGSYSIVYGSLGTGINTDFISEVQIKSFGMDAEFGGATGGMVNAVTKTGDNSLHAQVFAYFDIDSLQAKDKVPPRIDPSLRIPLSFDSRNRYEIGFTVAGPIIKDRLFYFIGYNPIRTSIKRTQVDPDQPFYGRQVEQKTETNTYYGKLNWMITTTQSLEFSVFGDPGKLPFGPNLNNALYDPPDSWEEVEFGGRNWTLKYNGVFFNDFLVEARVSQANNKFRRKLGPTTQSHFQVLDVYTGFGYAPGPGFVDGTDDRNRQYDLKLTKTFGPFELKAGYFKEDIEHKGGNIYQGPPGFLDPHTTATGQPYSSGAQVRQRYYMLDPNLVDADGHTPLSNIAPYYRIVRARTSPPLLTTKAPWEGYFIQGKYSWNNRLFVKAGFRWEEENMQGAQETYKFKAADSMAPRLSITWDPEGDGRNKIYAFYGKYFEKVPLDLAVRSLSREIGVSRSDFYTINSAYNSLSNPIENGVSIRDVRPSGAYGVAGSTTDLHFVGSAGFLTPVLPNTKLPYTTEYVLGWDMRPAEGLTISNRIIYRSVGRVLEDLGVDGGNNLPYFIGNPGENTDVITAMAAAIDPTLGNSVTPTASWPKPKRDYWAFEFEATKNAKNWMAFFNLRLSRLEGNYEGLFRNDNGQSDPNITSLFDFSLEYMKKYEDPNNPDYHPRGLTGEEAFASGPLPNDRTVVANGGVTYQWDFGFSLTTLVKFQTGTPLNKFYGLIDYDNNGELAAGGRGSMGRTPNTLNFDLSGQYVWKLANKHQISLRADIFNLWNVHKPVTYDQDFEQAVDAPNANFMNVLTYQTARRVRLGLKYQF